VAARIALLLAVTAALATVPVAGASSIAIAPGDTIDVTGTSVACVVVGNKEGVGCFLVGLSGLVPGTYGSQLSKAGDAVVVKVAANGSVTPVWRHRAKAGARATPPKYYKVKAGDTFGFAIKGGTIGCTVFDIRTGGAKYAGRRVVCFRAVKTRPIPLSYGVVVSDKFAGSLRFDAKGNVGATQFVRFQPR
jgi:hypothetical protein